jgi:voltage-gated potassium channel
MKLKERLYEIIFEADTRAGRLFDLTLLAVILINVLFVMLESISSVRVEYGHILRIAEWVVTIIFSIEYILRVWVVKNKLRYVFSFYGIIDLLSILPTFLELIFTGTHSLIIIRALRLLRIFRILKVTRYTMEGLTLIYALRNSRAKISIFFLGILMVVTIIGTIMYLIEGEEAGFTSIPRSIYWAIVTVTTVGFGDIVPLTALGQFLASFTMILGYSIIAVPTGIMTAEFSRARERKITTQVCPHCLKEGHDPDAVYCKYCSGKINQ